MGRGGKWSEDRQQSSYRALEELSLAARGLRNGDFEGCKNYAGLCNWVLFWFCGLCESMEASGEGADSSKELAESG